MKQTYCFERFEPPVLNEAMLRRELEKRAERWRTVLLVIAGVLIQIAAVLFAALVRGWYPAVSLAVMCSAILSTAAGGVIVILYVQRGGADYDYGA